MPIDLEQFLRYWRFSAAPFLTTIAEQEGGALTPAFIPPRCFAEVMGSPQSPQSCIVYADRGMGKSASRLEIERIARSPREGAALVIMIDDREALPAGDASAAEHVAQICRLTLLQLDAHLHKWPKLLTALQHEDPRSYDLLWLFWERYAPEGTYGRQPASPAGERLRGQIAHSDGPRFTLRRLADLARALGFASVYILFDSMDEGLSSDNLTPLADTLRPLLCNPGLLHNCGFAFKFFLPAAVSPHLRDQHAEWARRMPEHTISYTDQELQAIFSRRCEVSSRYGPTINGSYVSRFAQLCVPAGEVEDAEALDLEAQIIAAGRSPRMILRLAGQAIQQHCAAASRPDEPIRRASVQAAISALLGPGYRPAQITMTPIDPLQGAPRPAAPAPPARKAGPLTFYDDGRVLIGGEVVARLNGKLYTAMQILWGHRGQLVHYAQIEDMLYGADLPLRGDPKSSREKIIRRLREKLEAHNPDATVSRTYIDVTDGIGLVLRNYSEPEQRAAE